MTKHAHGDPRRPDGDMVTGLPPVDSREEPELEEFGPKVGWGHDAVYRPEPPVVEDGEEQGTPPEK